MRGWDRGSRDLTEMTEMGGLAGATAANLCRTGRQMMFLQPYTDEPQVKADPNPSSFTDH